MKGRQEPAENKPRCQDRINNHHREEKKMGFITERVKQTLPSLPTQLAAQVEELSTRQVLTVEILNNTATQEREQEDRGRSRERDTRGDGRRKRNMQRDKHGWNLIDFVPGFLGLGCRGQDPLILWGAGTDLTVQSEGRR